MLANTISSVYSFEFVSTQGMPVTFNKDKYWEVLEEIIRFTKGEDESDKLE